MPLRRDSAFRMANPDSKPYKIFDERGLFLLVKPSGSKLWRLNYTFQEKAKTLSLGPYPEVTLSAARAARDEARALLREGTDPSEKRQRHKAAQEAAKVDSFEAVARAWYARMQPTWDEGYAKAVFSRIENNLIPSLGRRRISEIDAPMMLETIRKIEGRNANDMAHRVNGHASKIFLFAIASGLATQDPANTIAGALAPTDPKHRPAKMALELAREVLIKTESLSGVYWSTLLCSRLTALTAARPGMALMAEMQEFEGLDGDEPLWRIPAAKMKLSKRRKRDISHEFLIPLSRQAADVARAAIGESFACKAPESENWLFPGVARWTKHISDSTLSKLYRDAGFRGQHVPHGWRASFSTIMNERAGIQGQAGDRNIIDMMLAHVQSGVEPIYNRSAYLPRRRTLAQEWADLLMEGMASPDTLLPAHRPWRAPRREPEHEGAGGRTSRKREP